jgi:hypothetical protein
MVVPPNQVSFIACLFSAPQVATTEADAKACV